MKASTSNFHDISDLHYHVRTWGDPAQEKVLLLHGWMDVSASWQFVVDEFGDDYYFIAPDWRGFGLTEWHKQGYWFPDYLHDLYQIIGLYSPEEPIHMIGHSMGGNVGGLYAGVFPEQIRSYVSMEGFGLAWKAPEDAPGRYRDWIVRKNNTPSFRAYTDFAGVEERLMKENPRLSQEKAKFLAPHWAAQLESGEVQFRSDPKHKMVNPIVYRLEESMACWRKITAPVLWIAADLSGVIELYNNEGQGRDLDIRKACIKEFRGLEIIAGAGHMFHHEKPEQLAEILAGFLQQVGG